MKALAQTRGWPDFPTAVCGFLTLAIAIFTQQPSLGQSPYNASHEPLGPSSRKTPICISEIMYKPADRTDGLNLEFVEIYNSNPFFHDIGGYQLIANNLTFTFPRGTIIPASGFFVVAASPTDMNAVYGLTTNVFGPYSGSLKKSDTIQLLDEVGSVLLAIPYSNHSPWPLAADGTGHSVVLANPTYGEADPRAWDVSELPGGSPGQAESSPITLRQICINEVALLLDSSGTNGFIELYNHSNAATDLSGCVLTDTTGTNKFTIPKSTLIGAGGYLSFKYSELGFHPSLTGAIFCLLSPDEQRVLDAIEYVPQESGVSLGRSPDGSSAFYPLSSPTLGAKNGPIYVGDVVINELMYNPPSGNDDDQFIELYNQGAKTVDLSGWKFISGVNFSFPQNITMAPDSYLVICRNVTNLLAKYSNLGVTNTIGEFTGRLSHKGDRVVLAKPSSAMDFGGPQPTPSSIYIVEDEVTYEAGGRWGQWSAGGGSSLELIDPKSNHRLAANWGDSDETQKSSWISIDATGVLDNGANYESSILHAQLGLLDVGECLVDNVEIIPGAGGNNLVVNPDFENGAANWSLQGCFFRSSVENSGFQSGHSLHIRCSDRLWTGDNSCQAVLAANSLAAGRTATLRFRARWLRGWPEALLRLNGNWLEASGLLPVPSNLGTPGARNSRFAANSGPAIHEVAHTPALPTAGQSVVVTARVDDPDGLEEVSLNYRIDPSSSYLTIPMKDDGADGDEIAGDGIFSAAIPGQSASRLAAFYISAADNRSANTRFPALLNDNAPDRECVILFGDGTAGGKFGVYHLWVTQTNATRWRNLSDLSNEAHDCTFVNGNRIIYNAQARFAGSPYHQDFDTPNGSLCHYKWIFPEDDKFLGATSFNKLHQPGNGAGDDATIQREQLANLFLRTLGAPWLNRRYVAVYVNGRRRGTLMEDAQTPDGDVINERFPKDSNGHLYKMQPWFEFAPTPSGNSIGFNNYSWCTLMPYTTGAGEKKAARYRYNFLVRRTPDSANNFDPVFALVDAANSYGSSNYVSSLENIADMENWMRVFAANHAAGNWDSFGAPNAQNLYGYIGTKGTRYSLLMWDFNIVFGNSGSWGPGQNLFTVNDADPNTANIYREPAFRRMYWRALQELVNGPLNVTNSGPLLDAKFATFTASGLSVQSPSSIKSWLTSARTSIASQIAAENTASFTVNPIASNDHNRATITGTAPFSVKTIMVNGAEWPVTWSGVTSWRLELPLQPGNNTLNITGVDLRGNPVGGASASLSAAFTGPLPGPAGQILINEIMSNPATSGAEYVELYNRSLFSYDLSGWILDGLSYAFPPGSFIASDSYLVLAAARLPFAEAYGASAPVFDTFTGSLPPTGAKLSLLRPLAIQTEIINQVQYQGGAPWPSSVIGSSLQLIDPSAGNNRVANWAVVTSDSITPDPQWQYVTLTGKATKSTLLIGLTTDGDGYVDDLKLVSGTVPEAGLNMIENGDFESPLNEPWTVSPNMANSVISGDIKHSGNASLHIIATSGGPTIGQAIWQTTKTLTTNSTYTLSYWYLPGGHSSSFLIRLSGSSPNAGHIYSLQPFQLPSPVAQQYTPGAVNSVRGTLPPFPSVWINEVQPDALNGITNSAGERSAWIELYNSGPESIDLTGLFLSDNYSNLLQSPFPNGSSIAAGEFKIVFGDGKINLSNANEPHTTFLLQSETGSLALSRIYDSKAQVIDFLDYSGLPQGTAYGSVPDGQGIIRAPLGNGTPGQSNSSPAIATGVVINEWMASNTRTIDDPIENQPDDWFELYNSRSAAVDLSGYFLTDTATNREKFRIPNGYVIPPGGFRLIWADKQNSLSGVDLHTNFKLSKSGTSIGLFAPGGATVDFVTFGAQLSDISQGRYPDGGNDISSMNPTPGTANVASTTSLNLTSPGDQFVYPGQTLTVLLQASGGSPGGKLTFSLTSSALPGASIDPETGVFTCTSPPGQVAGTNVFRVGVSDDSNPPGTAAASFNVITLELPTLTGTFEQDQPVLKWQSFVGKVYRLQSVDDLATGIWNTVGSDWTGNGDYIEFKMDTTATTKRFFRVLIVK